MKKSLRIAFTIIQIIITLIVSSLVLSACSSAKIESAETLSILRIGIVPDESQELLLSRYTPLAEYLSAELGVPYELIIPTDYGELLTLFHKGEVDLVYFGGFTFVQAYMLDNAIPLVTRDVDNRFTSYFLVRGDSSAEDLSDFEGTRFSFGSQLSTSGHLMPRYFLDERGMVPEDFFETITYSGKHDLTAFLVRDGEVDLGVANAPVIRKMIRDGRLHENELRILWETPPYQDYVWALRPVFDEATRINVQDAFLKLSRANEPHGRILDSIDAGSFLPASVDDFVQLQEIIENLRLLEQEK